MDATDRSRMLPGSTRRVRSKADPALLAPLAAQAVPRERLQADGYLPMMASSDLHRHGYQVRHWLRPGDPGSEVLEYVPRAPGLPRLTASSYAGQCAVHRALGLNIVPPGAPWEDYGGRGLFDGLLEGEAP